MQTLQVPGKGWQRGLNLNRSVNDVIDGDTNAIVLESLAYISRGQMLCLACLSLPLYLVLSRSNAMKLTYFSRFPLLAGLMALWLSLSGAQAATGLPAAEYAPRSGELTPREMTIARNAWQYFVANFQPTTAGECGKQIPLHHHVGQRLLSGRDDRSP